MRTNVMAALCGALAVAILLPCGAHAQKPDKISVWVVAQPGDGGFVSPGVPDSVKDIKSEIPKRSSLRLARTVSEADIILRVIERKEITREASGAIGVPVGTAVVAAPLGTEGNLLSTVIEVGDYRRPLDALFSGIGGVWKECAEQVSKQLHEWVVANRGQIVARRHAPK